MTSSNVNVDGHCNPPPNGGTGGSGSGSSGTGCCPKEKPPSNSAPYPECPTSTGDYPKCQSTKINIGQLSSNLAAGNEAFSSWRTQAGCLAFPLVSGGAQSLAWNLFPGLGTNEAAVGTDGWLPAGRGAMFSFLPNLVNGVTDSTFNSPYVRLSENGTARYDLVATSGVISYYSCQAPVPTTGRYNSTTKEFTEQFNDTVETFVYGGVNHATPGRLLRHIDRNNNQLTYNYRQGSRKISYFPILRSITGDVSGVIPYFFYSSETGPASPVTKITLLDTSNASNSRSIYFQYQDPTVAANSYLQKVTFPGGCVKQFQLVTTDLDSIYGICTAIRAEQDPDGYTTYFAYTDANNRIMRVCAEPEAKVTYFVYPLNTNVTFKQTRNPSRQNRWSYSLLGQSAINTTQYTDSLGFDTNYQNTSTSRIRCIQEPSGGKITYYGYTTPNQDTLTRIYTPSNGAKTYYIYQTNNYDVRSKIGPRNITGTFFQVSYYNYDANRNRISEVDALGNKTSYPRDAIGHIVKRQNARGDTSYYNYNAKGQNASVVDANNQVTYYGYSSFSDLTRAVAPRWKESGIFKSFTTYYEYTNRSLKRKSIDPLNQTTYYNYDNRGNLFSVVDPRGVKYQQITNGITVITKRLLYSSTGILVQSQYYDYDLVANRVGYVDQNNNKSYYMYDVNNRLIGIRDAIGARTYYAYDSRGNRTKSRDKNAHYTYYFYDSLNRKISIRDAIGNVSSFGYDLDDNIVKNQDPRLNTTYYNYDSINRPISRVNAANNLATKSYDSTGNVVKRTDELSQVTYYSYDKLNRLSSLVNSQGIATYYFYDASGNITKIRSRLPTTTYYFYDALNRGKVFRDSLGQSTYFFFDQVGNTSVLRNARAHATYYTYDAVNRLSTLRDALANVTYFGYDPFGNRVKIRDPLSSGTTSRYDAVNRPTAVTDALGNSTYFGYDSVGNRVKERDQRQNTTYFGYDALNRLSSILDPLGKTATYAYDAASNLQRAVDSNGQGTYFQYDALNRRIGIVYGPPGSQSQYFAYDAVGNLLKARTPDVMTTYRYDSLNRTTRKTSGSASVYFTYTTRGDNQSFVDTIRYPGNLNAYYTYDAANALSRVVHPTGTTTKYVRDTLSRPQKVQFGNGTVCYYAFDNAERVSSIRHFTSTGKGIAYFDYQRDASSRITKIARENISIYYGYDNVDRLTSEVWLNKGTGAQIYAFRYAYDGAGNRLKNYRERSPGGQIDTAYYKYDNANALVKRFVIPANTTNYYRYDANGALIKIFDGTNSTYFAYGPHQLISQITPPAADGQPWQFVYDGQLARRKIVKAGVASYYLWNGMNQIEERNAAGVLTARYTHGQSIVPGVGSVVEVQRVTATTTYFQYLHMDHQGSVAKITDSSQNTQLSYVNDAFGRQISTPTGLLPAIPNDLVFQTNWITAKIGTRRYGIAAGRVYDFEIGRFLTKDPITKLTLIDRGILQSKISDSIQYNAYKNDVFDKAFKTLRPTLSRKFSSYVFFSIPNKVDPDGFIDIFPDLNISVPPYPSYPEPKEKDPDEKGPPEILHLFDCDLWCPGQGNTYCEVARDVGARKVFSMAVKALSEGAARAYVAGQAAALGYSALCWVGCKENPDSPNPNDPNSPNNPNNPNNPKPNDPGFTGGGGSSGGGGGGAQW